MGLLLAILFAIYAIGASVALVYLWRRVERLNADVAELRSARSAGSARVLRHARSAAVAPIEDEPSALEDRPSARAALTWGLASPTGSSGSQVSPSAETSRGLLLGVLAIAPALGFFFRADAPTIVSSGLAVAAAMMVISLRPIWRAAAWSAVFTAGAWALLGFALGAAHTDPMSYSICIAFAGATGLLHTHLQRATPGATMALTMSAAALALASQTGMIGPAGAAFGLIVAFAAIVGALSLRLEAMHLAAFGASVIGLFVLSGQADAAIWFTPVTAWAGALFLGIAVIRVPQLGSRGVAIAGTGAFGALGALLSLNSAQHGLAHPYAAAGALLGLASVLGAVIAAAALRRDRGLQALRFSLTMLSCAGFIAIVAAIVLALPAPLAASASALTSLGFAALNMRFPEATWRAFSGAAALLTIPFAVVSAQMVVGEAGLWPAWTLIALGLAAPAAQLGGAAMLAARKDAPKLAALLEMLTMAFAVCAASLLVRLLFTNGAFRLHGVSFVETGMHSAVWLLAAILIGSRAQLGSTPMRLAGANLLMLAAVGVMATASLLWMTDYWTARAGAGPALLRRDTLGFLIPAVMFFAHWVFWRARSDDLQTRVAFGASMLLAAAFVTTEALVARGVPDWARALVGAASFALALGLNFAPGVANSELSAAPRQLEKNLHRNRRGQKRRQAREHAR